MSENAHRKEGGGRGVNLLNKFSPPWEPPLQPGSSSPARPPVLRAPGARRCESPWNPGSQVSPGKKKPQKVPGTRSHAGDDPRRRRAAFRSRRRGASEPGEQPAGGGGGARGPGRAGRDRGRRRRAAEDPPVEAAAQPGSRRAAAGLSAARRLRLQAGSSFQGPAKEGGMFANGEGEERGERRRGEQRAPPK